MHDYTYPGIGNIPLTLYFLKNRTMCCLKLIMPSKVTASLYCEVVNWNIWVCVFQPINIVSVVSERLSAMRKLQDNPNDVEAMGKMYKLQKDVRLSISIQKCLFYYTYLYIYFIFILGSAVFILVFL